jgi:hypothetical protein
MAWTTQDQTYPAKTILNCCCFALLIIHYIMFVLVPLNFLSRKFNLDKMKHCYLQFFLQRSVSLLAVIMCCLWMLFIGLIVVVNAVVC